jgi:hypothetical protein
MNSDHLNITEQAYRYLFLVQNRAYWHSCPFPYDPKQDLVLTYDFGVLQEIRGSGGKVEFLDHLIDPQIMEKYNYETYDFFAKWHLDSEGNDIFAYQGIKVGNAFRIAIWANITQYTRILINLLAVKKIKYEKIFAGIEDYYTVNILKALDIKTETWEPEKDVKLQEYYFPILRWIDESIYPSGAKQVLKSILTGILDLSLAVWDNLQIFKKKSINIFIHPYHPTQRIIEKLKSNPGINLIFENYTWTEGPFKERRLPTQRPSLHYKRLAAEMINKFQMKKSTHWNMDSFSVSDHLYPIIVKRIYEPLAECLKTVDSIIEYFNKKKLNLMVTIANIGFTNCLMINYCHRHNIPTYLIVNGLLTHSYLDEAKEATWINSYGESVKNNYFRGMDNVVCLGDPRMDDYINNFKAKNINKAKPTIVIGASGFSNVDLNSYVAVEFDFLHDILSACQKLKAQGRDMDIVLKVRPNGYIVQYVAFINEYFPEMTIQVYDNISMREVLLKADFFISIYSQTLFEASCLGIPVLYYKKDTQISQPPFDGKSELATAFCLDDLVDKMEMFYGNDSIYEAFLDKKVMGKYIGCLDGKSTERNIDFIYSLVDRSGGYG